MYQIEYQFSLDITDNSLKKMCEHMDIPYPVIHGGLIQTLTISNVKEIPTKEQADSIIQEYTKMMKKKECGKLFIVDVHFDHIVNITKITDANLKTPETALAKEKM